MHADLPPHVHRQAEMLGNRVRKTYQRLAPGFQRRNIGAFRLYDRDIPEIRAVVDWYEGHLVVGEYARRQTDELPGWLEAMAEGCGQALGLAPERLHCKRRQTRPSHGPRYGRLDQRGQRIEVREGDLKFLCNLDDFLDTGLFPDHRETRRLVRQEAAGQRLLNLFCYTGAFTVQAAAGGARQTTSVDLSATYLDWAQDNLALNGLAGPQNELVRADALAFVGRALRQGWRWDLIVCDPPSFSTSRAMAGDFDVLRDHRALVLDLLELLEPARGDRQGGVLWFSTNHQRFQPDLDGLPCQAVQEMTAQTVPPDYRNRQVHRCWRMVR